jgi:hypothetical protein
MNKNNIYFTGAVVYIVAMLQATVPGQRVNHESVAKRDIQNTCHSPFNVLPETGQSKHSESSQY